VHWTLGILPHFRAFSWLRVFPALKQNPPRPSASNANRWASGHVKFKIKNRLAGDCLCLIFSVLGFSVLQVMFNLPA